MGRADAPVVMIEYSDFQCPYCAKFAATAWPTIKSQLIEPGKMQFAFRHLPIESHQQALPAAAAAECAADQGDPDRFWSMHDLLFGSQRSLAAETIRAHAQSLGLALPRFDACVAGTVNSKVRADAVQARRLGVAGTPTFLIGVRISASSVEVKQRISGAQPAEAFITAVTNLLR